MLPEQNVEMLTVYVLARANLGVKSIELCYDATSATTEHFYNAFPSLEEAQQAQLIEKIKGNHYSIYCLVIPSESVIT